MKVFLHNSLTKKKEFFVPAQKNIVKIYVCGVTVYDLCHLGHARGAINFDVLKKLFQTLGYQVIFVKNYTDIDDKIIAESNKLNIPIQEPSGFPYRKNQIKLGANKSGYGSLGRFFSRQEPTDKFLCSSGQSYRKFCTSPDIFCSVLKVFLIKK